MPLKKTGPSIIRFFACWIVAILLEYPFIYSIILNDDVYLRQNIYFIASLHLMSALVLFFSIPKQKGWFHHKRCWPKTFFFLTLFLPFFGAVMSALLYIIYQEDPHPDKIFEEAEDFLMTQEPFKLDSAYNNISWEKKISESIDFIPLTDILSGDDIELKRGAIERLVQLATPEAIQILMNHRSDAASEVRFYITSALTRIKKSIDDKLDAAKIEMKKDVYKISARVFLAKMYIWYANSNLLDASTNQTYLNEANYHLNYSIDSKFASPEIYWLLLDIHSSQGDWDKYMNIVKAMEKNNIISIKDRIKTKLKYFYHTRRFDKFMQELQQMENLSDIEPEWLAMANWWGLHR